MRSNVFKKRILEGFLIVGISFCLLVTIELVLRLLFPEKELPPRGSAVEFNPNYLIKLKPNIESFFIRADIDGGDVIHWRTNKSGFRGQEIRNNPDVRIIVYGDSNIHAYFSEDKNTFPSKLEKYLDDGFTNIEVINGGIAGFGPDQSLIRFSLEADIFKPDIVILHLFAENDFGDLIRNRLFELQGDTLVPIVQKRDPGDFIEKNKGLNYFIKSLRILSIAPKIFKYSNERMKTATLSQNEKDYLYYKKGGTRSLSTFIDYYDIDIALNLNLESERTKKKLMESVLSSFKYTANSKKIALLVLIQPSSIDLTTNFPFNYTYLSGFPSYSRDRISSILDNICNRVGVARINLFNVFLKNEPEKLYFMTDVHWNDAGQDLAAKETAKYIRNHEMIQKIRKHKISSEIRK